MINKKVLLAVLAVGVTAAGTVLPVAATTTQSGGAQPYGGVRVVRP